MSFAIVCHVQDLYSLRILEVFYSSVTLFLISDIFTTPDRVSEASSYGSNLAVWPAGRKVAKLYPPLSPPPPRCPIHAYLFLAFS